MNHLIISASLIICLSVVSAFGQDVSYPLWKSLKSGQYKVGFEVINYMDSSRNITSKIDKEGEKINNRFFPIQVAVWYPTEQDWSEDLAMPFNEYFYLTAQKNDFRKLTEDQRENAMEIFYNYAKFGLEQELSQEQLQSIGKSATASLPNALPTRNRFPVILAGHDGGVWKISTLCEFLASYGFVVVSTGPLSQTSGIYSDETQIALNRRIRTFEIVREMLSDFQSADESKIGLMGLNSDGMSSLLYQMKNQEADAMVSIDGWEGKNNGSNYVKQSVYYNLDAINVPRLEFHQHESPSNEALFVNTEIFDSLQHVDRFYYIMKDFGHAYLTGNTIALPNLSDIVIDQHIFWYNSVLLFFNGQLKNDHEATKRLWDYDQQWGNKEFFHRQEKIKASH